MRLQLRGRVYFLATACIAAGFCLFLLTTRISTDRKYQAPPQLVVTQLPALAPLAQLQPLSVLDASQKYRVRHFIAVADGWQQLAAGDWPTCLALHSTLSHAHHVAHQARSWSGPISVALFAAGDDVHLLLAYIAFLRRCRPHVRDRMSFHVLWPASEQPSEVDVASWARMPEAAADCGEDDEKVLQRLVARQARSPGKTLSYPQNLGRNTARLACPSGLSLCPDADMLPGPTGLDLSAALAGFFRRQPPCNKCAYVLPVFELDAKLPGPPRNKAELRALVKKKNARPFHWSFFKPNQKPLDPMRWLDVGNDTSTELSVAYEFKYSWPSEPVYVAASNDLPVFNEMYVGYGYTRNTQAYEMFVTGWKFFALDNAFLVHWGFQSLGMRPKWRWAENRVNTKNFNKWTSQIAIKYDADPMLLIRKYNVKGSKLVVCPRESCSAVRQNNSTKKKNRRS